MPADKQRSSIHGFAHRATASVRANSKQSNQSWLNELLIISRTRQNGEGNCPYNGGAKYARPTVCKCGEGMSVKGWKTDFVGPGVLLDKYREKQRHGGSNENENKGALRNYGSPARVQRRGATSKPRKPRYVSDAHETQTKLSSRRKNRTKRVGDRRRRSCSLRFRFNHASNSREVSILT